MKNDNEKFLEFNGKRILFSNSDGTYWVALKPILDALGLKANRYLKRTKRDYFFGRRLDTMSIQVEKNGVLQGRKMICLPEKYIYGWICILNSDSKELEDYKETCYDLLFDHFRGQIGNRKELLIARNKIKSDIYKKRQELKEQQEGYQELKELESKQKQLSAQLNKLDSNIVNQTEMKL